MQHVSKIACDNDGGFVMRFRVKWKEGEEKKESKWSGKYPINQSKTMDLRKLSIPPGTEVWPEADAVLGKQKDAWEHVIYSPDTESVATYRVYGASYYIHVDLLD
jgi:hypothetical protein